MRFTNAHSPSSVCTPTRYGILTGRYPWRTKLPIGVLRGYGEVLLEKDRTTIASFLKENGYTTGVVGKWHLGLDWAIRDKYKDSINESTAQINEFGTITQLNGDWVDFTKKPTDGPLNHGFDYCYKLPASLDMPPIAIWKTTRFWPFPMLTCLATIWIPVFTEPFGEPVLIGSAGEKWSCSLGRHP